MSFQQTNNAIERWTRFLTPLSTSIKAIPSLQRSFASPSAFEDLLQHDDASLSALDEIQWMHLDMIVTRFADDWQTWFTREMYPSIFRQREQRPWAPAELPLASIDFFADSLLLHLWAPWNGYSRKFDETFSVVARRFANRMTFRSFNVDWQSMHDYFSETDLLQGPNHIYYNKGIRLYTGFGMPSIDELSSQIERWLVDGRSR